MLKLISRQLLLIYIVHATQLIAVAQGPQVSFNSPPIYTASIYNIYSRVFGSATGDFNGDGKLDLAAAGTAYVAVLIGNGDGTFQPTVYYDIPIPYDGSARSVAVGDFNRDGKVDLAVGTGNDIAGSVAILLGNGDGTFQTAATYPALANPYWVATEDFNGDGILDLAVTGGGGTVSILTGKGDGTFGAPVNFPAGNLPGFVIAGDFNGDGKLDLAVANNDAHANTISILLGTGNGNFAPPVNYGSGGATGIALGDFNGDGKLDLAFANRARKVISVLPGNGDGTFGPQSNYGVGARATSLSVGDFTGDGKLDLVSDTGAILVGNGDGSFQKALQYYGPNARFVTVGDFNGDGRPDLAVITDAGIMIVLGTGSARFQHPHNVALGAGSSATGDFNGDGNPDLAVIANGGVSVLLGNGDGTFRSPVSYAAGQDPSGVVAGDFNGDGILDLAIVNTTQPNVEAGSVAILLGKGDGTFLPAIVSDAPEGAYALVAADFNGDGNLDVAVINSISGNVLPYYGVFVAILFGQGNGVLVPDISYNTPETPLGMAVGDFNGDGKPDLAVISNGPIWTNVYILLNRGDGTFQPMITYGNIEGATPNSLAVGDINNDGFLDLVLSSGAILLGNGDGTFQVAPFTIDPAGSGIVIRDLNGDGNADLVFSDGYYNEVEVYQGNGDATFQPPLYFAVANQPSFLAVADFNRDGHPDVAVSAPTNITILTNATSR